jgi:acetyl-CoA C-acetyltransferase
MSDGSAIVFLASKETAEKLVDKPIWVTGTGMGTDTMRPGDRYDTVGGLHEYDLVLSHEDKATRERYKKLRYPGQNSFRAGRMSAKQAYYMADIKNPLKELDVVEIHDAFSSSEIQTYEDLGLCPYGKGGEFVMSGAANLDGEVSINPSGGLIGMGHSVGSSGVWQILFTYLQLRGDIDKVFKKWNERFKPYNGNRKIPRPIQIPNAKRGASHSHAGTGSHVTYTILSNVESDLERIKPLAGWESKLIRRPN